MHSVTRLTVGRKLLFLIAVLLATALWTMTTMAVRLFKDDNTLLVQQLNLHDATGLSAEVSNVLERWVDESKGLLPLISEIQPEPLRMELEQNTDVLSLSLFRNDSGVPRLAYHASSPSLRGMTPSQLQTLENASIQPARYFEGSARYPLVTWISGSPRSTVALSVSIHTEGRLAGVLTVLFDAQRLETIFKRSEGLTAYLISQDGTLLSHSDRRVSPTDRSKLPELKEFLSSGISNKQFRYRDPDTQEARMAAFRKVGIGNWGVVAEVPESIALEASDRVIRASILSAVVILCMALLIGSIFSGKLVFPILELTDAAQKISKGKFEARVRVSGQTGDEIHRLSQVFNQMASGLQERERYKEVLSKFHSPEIAAKMLSGEIKLGGEKREIVILFVDLRNFTRLSDGISPEVVVEILNEYFGKMVRVIRRRGGVIDKFIGDAIMATWGAPTSSPRDAENAVMACLELRHELKELNAHRAARLRDPLQIGMGLNLGEAIAGNIGSEERMEYTVIGDAVNMASRLESMTKELRVDLLVSESIRKSAGERFHFVAGPKISIRGKAEELQVYQVASGQPEEEFKKAG